MNFKYHGNYCGPGYTDGKYKLAEEGDYNIKPIDQLDSFCKLHDKEYKSGDYLAADKKYYQQPTQNLKHYISQLAIGTQAKLRELGIMNKTKHTKQEIKQIKSIIKSEEPRKTKLVRKNKMVRPKGNNYNPPVSYTIPKKLGNKLSIGSKRLDARKTLKVNGREFLGNITLAASTTFAPGDTMFTQNIAPQDIAASRLFLFSTMYEKYRFRKLRLDFVSQVATSEVGQFIAYFDYDPADSSPTGTDAVVKAYSASTNVASNFWSHTSFIMNQNLAQTSYYTSTGIDNRVEVQAVFNMIINSALTTTAAHTIGSVYITYECDFYGAEFQSSISNNSIGHATYIKKISSIAVAAGTNATLNNKVKPLNNNLLSLTSSAFFNDPATDAGSIGIALTFNEPGLYQVDLLMSDVNFTIVATGGIFDGTPNTELSSNMSSIGFGQLLQVTPSDGIGGQYMSSDIVQVDTDPDFHNTSYIIQFNFEVVGGAFTNITIGNIMFNINKIGNTFSDLTGSAHKYALSSNRKKALMDGLKEILPNVNKPSDVQEVERKLIDLQKQFELLSNHKKSTSEVKLTPIKSSMRNNVACN